MLATLSVALALSQAAPVAQSRDDAYAKAVQERIDGKTGAAISHLRVIIAGHPDDVDFRLQLGLALKAEGRDRPAEREFREVLSRTPDYKDARVALADLQLARGDIDGAKKTLGPALLAATDDPDVSGLLARMNDAAATARWRLDASALVSHLSQGLPEWKEANLSLSKKVGARSAITGRVQQLERFHLQETYVEAEFDHGWTGGEWAVAVGGSLDPLFRAEHAVKASLLLIPQKRSPWRLLGDVNYSHYLAGDVTTLRLGAERDVHHGRGVIGARMIQTWDPDGRVLSGYELDGKWTFTDRIDAGLSYVDAAESDAGIVVRTNAIGLGVGYRINDRTSLQPTIAREERENSYDRLEIGLGVTLRF